MKRIKEWLKNKKNDILLYSIIGIVIAGLFLFFTWGLTVNSVTVYEGQITTTIDLKTGEEFRMFEIKVTNFLFANKENTRVKGRSLSREEEMKKWEAKYKLVKFPTNDRYYIVYEKDIEDL